MRRGQVLAALRAEWQGGSVPMAEPTGEARGALSVALRLGFAAEEVTAAWAVRPSRRRCLQCRERGAPFVPELGEALHPGCADAYMEAQRRRSAARRGETS